MKKKTNAITKNIKKITTVISIYPWVLLLLTMMSSGPAYAAFSRRPYDGLFICYFIYRQPYYFSSNYCYCWYINLTDSKKLCNLFFGHELYFSALAATFICLLIRGKERIQPSPSPAKISARQLSGVAYGTQ